MLSWKTASAETRRAYRMEYGCTCPEGFFFSRTCAKCGKTLNSVHQHVSNPEWVVMCVPCAYEDGAC
jgi:hypothetical protein